VLLCLNLLHYLFTRLANACCGELIVVSVLELTSLIRCQRNATRGGKDPRDAELIASEYTFHARINPPRATNQHTFLS
jgi:hypothetical protein